jgi:nitroreductase
MIALSAVADGALVACPICGSRSVTCVHRIPLQVLLHAGILAAILWSWSRVSDTDAPPEPPRRIFRAGAALLIVGMALALAAELVKTETLMVSGSVLIAGGCLLAGPGVPRPSRIAGLLAVFTALLGFYVVVVFKLSPEAARWPLFALGTAGMLASLTALVRGASRKP